MADRSPRPIRTRPAPDEPSFIDQMEQALTIDKHKLEDETQQHADLFWRVAKQVALTTSQRDEVKQRVSEAEAEVDAQVRHDMEVAEERITETKVASAVALHKDVLKARDELHAMNKQLGLLMALKESFQQRSFMLRELCALYIANYYSTSEGGPAKRVRDAADAEQVSRLRREDRSDSRRG